MQEQVLLQVPNITLVIRPNGGRLPDQDQIKTYGDSEDGAKAVLVATEGLGHTSLAFTSGDGQPG